MLVQLAIAVEAEAESTAALVECIEEPMPVQKAIAVEAGSIAALVDCIEEQVARLVEARHTRVDTAVVVYIKEQVVVAAVSTASFVDTLSASVRILFPPFDIQLVSTAAPVVIVVALASFAVRAAVASATASFDIHLISVSADECTRDPCHTIPYTSSRKFALSFHRPISIESMSVLV